ncbi:carotenoid oxygenase family protein [Antrihabitans sp. YC2-6]|uniref:carotenoid oxygenase family protein n=1 Tax=Antrihabitans sp. YC2-6 TaxID=2799498 RepID=UPI0018F28EFC|nr:carotenoid oxygenase family protein [Antrihabitans sp. YC2-6]MBJ8348865.1 carotenoid oxygenase family protein [Antrihabitans sp. YC2-6]
MTTTAVAHPAAAAAFRPAVEAPADIVLELTGTLPQELRGTLYRNGPGQWESGGFYAAHPFDGDGLVSKFVIDEGRVRYQSKYVRTPKFLAEQRGHGDRVRGIYTQAKALRHNAGRMPADCANTHVVYHAERLLALSDAGRPWAIDPDDLTTIGQCTFDGRLPQLTRFSPHPKIDPLTGEMFNFGLDLAPRLAPRVPAGLRCYRVDPGGRIHSEAVVPLDDVVIQHDFAITQNYLVFAIAPIAVDPVHAARALLGFGNTGDTTQFRPELGMKIVLVPRCGGRQRVIECDPLVYVHVNNAYEDGSDIVLDIVRHPSFDLLAVDLKQFRTQQPGLGWPARLRIGPAGRVEVEDIDLQSVEFPVHDERRTGRQYRYSYFSQSGPGFDSAIVKLDNETGEQRAHTFAHGEFPGEPIFVRASTKGAEDDGWLLVVAYLPAEHRTALFVLDAADIEHAPIAVAHLDRHVFPGFHGSFTERVAGPAVL